MVDPAALQCQLEMRRSARESGNAALLYPSRSRDAATRCASNWPVLSLPSMDDDQKEILRKTFPEARGLVVSMITAALAAQVDGDEDLFGEVLAELGNAQRVTIRAVLMTQTWTLVNAIMAMAAVAETDPRSTGRKLPSR